MTPDPTFAEFLARVRAGDAAAADELVRRYEPAIRVIVRARLGAGLRRQLDSMDVCQSVLGTFFARAALGQYDLATPGELVALLARMTRNKLASQARHHTRDRRDARPGGRRGRGRGRGGRRAGAGPGGRGPGAARPTPRAPAHAGGAGDRRPAGGRAGLGGGRGGDGRHRRRAGGSSSPGRSTGSAPDLGLIGDGDE